MSTKDKPEGVTELVEGLKAIKSGLRSAVAFQDKRRVNYGMHSEWADRHIATLDEAIAALEAALPSGVRLADILRGGTISVSGGDITIAFPTSVEAGEAFDALLDLSPTPAPQAKPEAVKGGDGHSPELKASMESVVKSLKSRPAALRGPFKTNLTEERHSLEGFQASLKIASDALDNGPQPPTPASGDQMEVAIVAVEVDGEIEFWEQEGSSACPGDAFVTLDAANKAIADRDAIIGQLNDQLIKSRNYWSEECAKALRRSKAAEAELQKLKAEPYDSRDGLSKWRGWDDTNEPWSQTHHKDSVLEAMFRDSWSVEDAAALLGFIDRTWGSAAILAQAKEVQK